MGSKIAGEDTIDSQMRLGDLLIRAGLVTEKDVANAVERLKVHGGRLGDNLVSLGVIEREALDGFLHRIPQEPANIEETGIE